MNVTNLSISVEISYYPLTAAYGQVVDQFLKRIKNTPGIHVDAGPMSTLLSGEYNAVFDLLLREIRSFMEQYPSVFTLKISNACPR